MIKPNHNLKYQHSYQSSVITNNKNKRKNTKYILHEYLFVHIAHRSGWIGFWIPTNPKSSHINFKLESWEGGMPFVRLTTIIWVWCLIVPRELALGFYSFNFNTMELIQVFRIGNYIIRVWKKGKEIIHQWNPAW